MPAAAARLPRVTVLRHGSAAWRSGNTPKPFRADLYYRLKMFPSVLPPLWKQAEDIAPLVAPFVSKYAAKYGKHIDRVSAAPLAALWNRV